MLLVLLLGTGLRLGLHAGNQALFSHPQVDELEYLSRPQPPFQRPPATYLLAGLPFPRWVFGALSLLPSLLMLTLAPPSYALLAILLALEPTLALSGVQILPEAPAAALVTLSLLLARRGRSRLAGFCTGTAALFRAELLLLPPLFALLGKRGRRMALFALPAVLPVMAVNAVSGGGFSVAATGGVNLWVGSDWDLLTTPPGVEFEEMMRTEPADSFTERARNVITADPSGWLIRGVQKSLAFFTLPGPGRNLDSREAVRMVFPLLLITAMLLAGVGGFGRNPPGAFMAAALVSAFLFFPSMRYRAVFLPAFALAAWEIPRWRLVLGAVAVAALSVLFPYPGHVRAGLNTVLTAQNALRENRTADCLRLLDRAEAEGYRGADLHNIRASAMALEDRGFQEVFPEFARALEAAPGSPTVWRNTAVYLWNTGRVDPAREAAMKALSLDPRLEPELRRILTE